ncbi:MAG: flagellar hook-associated protein FlgL [Anaeromusa sp.]|uniref:flagellar hook-associated protein FlgL n=1 Tax=Anaeromusa sp. TaxID=1872520 RepID=UPI0026277558|nr:flagellar hook-associated protein FlgL [Anaeromusa sp.]MDD3158570.1 flagellar hook-associated protein FlgL [Anaeromusa sp.]MEA4834518.1 flagellar hook-associated protein FlgL [Anaeromusa sp.]
MRITNNMMFDSSIRNLNNNLLRLNAAEVRHSTQSKIQVPSDDPVIATRAIKYRDYVADVEQYQKNTSDATSWMEVSDDATQKLVDSMTRLKELITSGANDTNSTSSRAAIADEVKQIKKGLVDTMNSSYAGRYIFAGYNTDEPPYKLVTETLSSGAKVDKVLYKGQALSVGGPVSASIPNADILNFCDDKVAKSAPVYNQKGTWTLTANGTEYSVDLSAVTNPTTLQNAIDTAAGAGTFTVGTNAGYLTLTPGGAVTSYVIGSQSDLGFASSYKSGVTAQDISYHVSQGSEVKVNLEGQNVVGWSGDKDHGGYTEAGSNIFDTIDKLLIGLNGESSYKVASYNTTTLAWEVKTLPSPATTSAALISSCLGDLETDLNRVTKAQSELGARMNYVESTDSRLGSNQLTYTKLLSNNEDIDVAQSSMEVSTAQSVYEGALAVTAKVTKASLVDYLR